MGNMQNQMTSFIGFGNLTAMAGLGSFIILLLLWSIFWKGLALWHGARRGKVWWFVIFLFLNTAGILEIIFLFAVLKLKFDQLFKID
jgi:hypothetical protein